MAPHDSITGLEERVSRSIVEKDAVAEHLRTRLLADKPYDWRGGPGSRRRGL